MSDFFLPNVPEDLPETALLVKFGAEWADTLRQSSKKALSFVEKTFFEHDLQPDEQLAVWRALENWRIDSERPFVFLLDLLAWTGRIPVYPPNATLTPYAAAVLPRIVRILQKWAAGLLVADILKSYHVALRVHGRSVATATQGRLPPHLGVRFLHKTFGRVIHVRPAWFRDSYILRRAVRILPL